jgi:hypothetical protein
MRQIVNATQIDKWFGSASRDAQELLPHLVRKLITITVDPNHLVSPIRIPVGDQVNLPGYDGTVVTTTHHLYVPEKQSVWEMGTGDPKQKAEEVYNSRSKDPRGIDPQATTFVFLTPHVFRKKDDWLREKNAQGLWKDVIVIDVVDLDNWLEQKFGVARWLAREMGVPVEGVRDLEGFKKEELDARYGVIISPQLIVAGRDEALSELHQWTCSDTREVRIEGDSIEESAAFITAAVLTLPEKDRESVVSRVLFVTNVEILDYLTSLYETYILVPLNPEVRRKAASLACPQLRIISPVARAPGGVAPNRPSISLGPIGRHACEEALVSMGFLRQKAERIARESKGKLAAVLWMIAEETDTPAKWTTPAAARELVPILLAGQWVVDNKSDKAALEQLTSCDYAEVERRTAKWTHPAGPIVRRGPISDWLAWDYAWVSLAPFIERTHIETFLAVAKKVLGTLDPKLELDKEQRWAAAMFEKEHPYSSPLRSGLIGTVVQLAVNSHHLTSFNGQSIADRFVEELLGGKGASRNGIWLSVAQWLPDLAEGAPSAFLKTLEVALKDEDFVSVLFEESGMFGWSAHTYVLWALERLAWSKEFLSQVTLALGELADLDPGGRTSNRPSNSLTGIFLPWRPHTDTNPAEQFDAIDLLYSRKPEIAWNLAVSLLPDETRVAFPTAEPAWRSWKPYDEKSVKVPEYWLFVEELLMRMIKWAEHSGERWASLVRTYNALRLGYPKLAEQLVSSLQELNPQELEESNRTVLAESLRKKLAQHREVPEANWAMNEKELRPLGELYEKFKPNDPVEQNTWLFTSWPDIPKSEQLGYEQHMVHVQEERRKAVEVVYVAQGLPGLYSLAEKVERPDEVGIALSRISIEQNIETEFLDHALGLIATKNQVPVLLRMVWGYILGMYRDHGNAWVDKVIATEQISWNTSRYTNFALGLPPEPNTWDKVREWSENADNSYWERTSIHYLENPERDGERVIKRLLQMHRPYRALDLSGMSIRSKKRGDINADSLPIPSELIINVLEEAPKFDPGEEWYPPSISTISHHVEQLLDILEKEEADTGLLVKLEWIWMPLLEHGTRGLRSLQAALSTDPRLFVELLKLVFRAENEEARDPSDQDNTRAMQAYRLLEAWKKPPGTIEMEPVQHKDNGDIIFPLGLVNEKDLFNWTSTARKLAQECGRLEVCDSRIGQVLAFAPKDPDETWPCQPVRDLLEDLKSDKLERGLAVGVYNKRGVHQRIKGGVQERMLAEKFRNYATRVQSKWPRTGALLRSLADGYERDAKWEDERDSIEEFE